MNQELKDKLWKLGKYAKKYPPEYILIPVLDVIEILEDKNE